VTSDTTHTERDSLIASARFVLWDLDGPICRLFAGYSADGIARELVQCIDGLGMGSLLGKEERSATDPHVALLAVNRQRPDSDLIRALEEWLTRRELEAVPTAMPTPFADPVIRTWASGDTRFAITTNNSGNAASAYIETRGLEDCFRYIGGRTQNLDLMKPDPHCLQQALKFMGAHDPSQALMFGDAPTDYEAARKAGVHFLGYARNPRKLDALLAVGVKPEFIVSSLEEVLEVLRRRP
jgi:phosphoglycolate phosphatase-like HAD superfamily hydrolase